MEPFAATHEKDVHGGANSGGVVAECTDCRLPHDTAAHHLFAKARTGLRDLWAQAINFAHKPDWIGLLEERSNYVYGSGCLDCHAALERASRDNPTAAAVHDAYFADTEGQSCVDCHQHIGLAGLRDAFVDYFDEVEPSDVPGREEAPAPGAASEQG